MGIVVGLMGDGLIGCLSYFLITQGYSLLRKGLWYQGKLRGRITRALSVVAGSLLIGIGALLIILTFLFLIVVLA